MMNHNITVEKFGIRLRPVTMNDAAFIYRLRRSPKLSKYIGEIDDRYAVHLSWLEEYMKREGDYYFTVELSSGKPVGTIAIYSVTKKDANWGRWIIEDPIPAAPASAWLMYHVAFDILEIPQVYCETVMMNSQIVSFHDNCGLTRSKIKPKALTIKKVPYDLVIHTAERAQCKHIQKKLEPSAQLAERLLKGM